jgi:hypothetical protein
MLQRIARITESVGSFVYFSFSTPDGVTTPLLRCREYLSKTYLSLRSSNDDIPNNADYVSTIVNVRHERKGRSSYLVRPYVFRLLQP